MESRTATFQHERAERSLIRATSTSTSKNGVEKVRKSTKSGHRLLARSAFSLFSPVLFRIKAQMEQVRRFPALHEQLFRLLRNSKQGENRSVKRTNLAEQAETEQLADQRVLWMLRSIAEQWK